MTYNFTTQPTAAGYWLVFLNPGSRLLFSRDLLLASWLIAMIFWFLEPGFAQTDGVCARVGLRLDQSAVMTRTAFRATLQITDHDPATPMNAVGAEVQIKDASGNLANDRFQIEAPTLENIDRVDGSGTIGAITTATIRWLLIPTDEAAPVSAADFFVGGQLTYTLGGNQAQVPLEPVKITVYPDAALDLIYFHQREVFSDDPFTPEVEPAIPYALAVMVKNRGAGPAKSLTISSAQPQIVSNDKGLAIDFQLVGAVLDGTNAPNSLSLNFGQIDPGTIKVAKWFFTSSLQGFFQNFSATFQHQDTLGSIHLSTIKSVSIHEMARIVDAGYGFSDGKPDFLVNDVPDRDNLPDTLYFSDGTTNTVQGIQQFAFDSAPSESNPQVQLSVPASSGWVYLRVPEPSGGQMALAGVTRSDGVQIKLGTNTWTTDRVFPGPGVRAITTNLLHILDYNSSSIYTLTYSNAAPADTTPPTSRITALPAQTAQQFTVTWSGQDNAGGSGLGYFNIFVSENSGPFQPWLQQTTLRGAIYSGNVGSSYAFYSVATDNAGNRESAHGSPDTTTAVTVVNHSPVQAAIPDQDINEGITFVRNITASDPDAGETLTYRLGSGAPVGMNINPNTGKLSWPTGEAAGPGTNLITVIVTDHGLPSLSATQSFRLFVNEVNMAPVLPTIADQAIKALRSLVIANTAGDGDIPGNSLTYRLVDPPAGAAIDSNGVITWTPAVAQAPGTNWITTVVTDDGFPQLSATNTVRVVVQVPNFAPVLAAIADRTINEGFPLCITNAASDTDLPSQNLTFSLGPGAPAGATINQTSGVFFWRPADTQGPSTNNILVIVTDTGTPSLSATQHFAVVVLDTLPDVILSIASTNMLTGTSNHVPVTLQTALDITNLAVVLQTSARLTNIAMIPAAPEVVSAAVLPLDENQYAVNLALSLVSQTNPVRTLGKLAFMAVADPHSAIVPLALSALTATRSDGKSVSLTTGNNARIIIVGDEPVLEVGLSTTPVRLLTLHGRPESSYTIERALSLPGGGWEYLWSVFLTNLSQTFTVTDIAPVQFYRAYSHPGLPIINSVPDVSVPPGTAVVFTNMVNPPGQPFSFALDPTAPVGASISTNGLFNWTPTCAQGGTTNRITVWAMHTITPALSNSMSFNIVVGDCLQVGVGGVSMQTGEGACTPLNLLSTAGLTNLTFVLEYASNLLGGWTVTSTNPAVGTATVQVIDSTRVRVNVIAAPGNVLQGLASVGSVCFNALPGASAFVPVTATSVVGTRSDGLEVSNAFGQTARLVIIGSNPLLEASLSADRSRLLTLYGKPGSSYAIEWNTNLLDPLWQPRWNVPMTNLSQTFGIDSNPPNQFYRAQELFANPPLLELSRLGGSNLVLLLYGRAGTNYFLQTATSLSPGASWTPLTNFTLANSFQFFDGGIATNARLFYRAVSP